MDWKKMKKNPFERFKIRTVDISTIDDRLLVANLYLTQGLTLLASLFVFALQWKNPLPMLSFLHWKAALGWGGGFGAVVLAVDMLISKWVPEEVSDDGGVNEKLFGSRALWHVVLLSAIVAFCEEMLFRGAIQSAWGPYWTSILFAAIHVRYLKHWVMTGLVFGISYGLGLIYNVTGTLWCPIAAHFLIDCVMGMIIRLRREV